MQFVGSVGGVGQYVDRVYDGVLGPEPYRAYVPHGIAGWNPEISEQTAERVKAAIAHLQFETIHPFPDGNGRVGRALIHCVMHRRRIAKPALNLLRIYRWRVAIIALWDCNHSIRV